MFESLISIIIPCFGNDKRLEYALDSLSAQDYVGFDVILVVDQEDEKFYRTIGKKKYSNFTLYIVYLGSNTGITNATVQGIVASKAEWVALLDQDDWLEPSCLSKIAHVIENSGSEVHSIFTSRANVFQGTTGFRTLPRTYNGWDLGKHFKDPILTGLTHTWLSHLKVYKKSKFQLTNDVRLDGIQDWYWNLDNSLTGASIYIDSPEYNHRIHQDQNTNSERYLKSISKIQFQRDFVVRSRSPLVNRTVNLDREQKLAILNQIRSAGSTVVCEIGENEIDFYPYTPSIILHKLKNPKASTSAILVIPFATIEFSEIYFYIGSANTPQIGIVASSDLTGSIQTLKNLGGLLDFCITLDIEAEIFASWSGIKTYHLEIDSTLYHSLSKNKVSRPVGHPMYNFVASNIEKFDQFFPRGSLRRRFAARLYRKFLI